MFLWSGICAAAEFKADCIHSNKFYDRGKPTSKSMVKHDFTSKLYVKGKKEREETDRGKGMKSIVITRKDKGVVWVLFPEKKEYIENSLKDGGYMPGFRQPMPDAIEKKKSLGKALLNGFICDKYQITVDLGYRLPVKATRTVWESSKLGRPVKIEQMSKMFTSSTELKNIKQTKLSDSLFEIPKGYKKSQFKHGNMPKGGTRSPSKNK